VEYYAEGGDILTLDALKDIARAEEKCRQEREAAISDAKRRAEQAEAEGRKTVEEAAEKAYAEVRRLIEEAEAGAYEEAKNLQKSTDDDCAALREKAMERLDKAAAIVVERIVGRDVH
jgi:vacuolar-type H+-ATPase subunit H